MSSATLFDNNDEDYRNWLHNHASGYVLNTARGLPHNYMVLHRATCPSISEVVNHTEGAFTERDYVKVCAESREDLRRWVRAHGRPDGTFSSEKCPHCKP